MFTAIFVSKLFLEIATGLKFVREGHFIPMRRPKEELQNAAV
jgi:hypothetical protein